ncbi:AraC family transcriptional regulator [Ktedonosporobacter rubrisoli]|uniref:AraC family transcriptional regulator n=1 Tax=Ktedonosporobacter rubrisoli TaxID=2509675 RepID=A0A4P6JY82_KTERU|nr:helix-turn-helix transcriptional regulator [Ktedonosporobacter rubrisoli]QBD80432.1 AraC family transcriptional regulator [Ktedonosporobacter rubrisoli]
MSLSVQVRQSASPYVESIWRGAAQSDTPLICPADGRWKLLFAKLHGRMYIAVEGPMTRAIPTIHSEGIEWLVIKFQLGTFLRPAPARSLLDAETILPLENRNEFRLDGFTWQVPDYNNAETFVAWLVRENVLLSDPVVMAVLADHPHQRSLRTVRHRFVQATGLTYMSIRQIERARFAMSLLQQGFSILDVVAQAGYADQAHLTRSFKRFMGQTPAHFTGMRRPASLPHPSPRATLAPH